MLKRVEEDGKYVEITGFRNVTIADSAEFLKAVRKGKRQGVWVQFFDGELVATWEHLYFAVLNALMAFRNKRAVSKDLAMEVMLYASAQRQIRKAIALMGVKCNSASVATVIIVEDPDAVKPALSAVSKSIGAEPDDSVLELSHEKLRGIREAFGITAKELEAVEEKDDVERAVVNLVLERMALLSTQL